MHDCEGAIPAPVLTIENRELDTMKTAIQIQIDLKASLIQMRGTTDKPGTRAAYFATVELRDTANKIHTEGSEAFKLVNKAAAPNPDTWARIRDTRDNYIALLKVAAFVDQAQAASVEKAKADKAAKAAAAKAAKAAKAAAAKKSA